MAGDQSLFTAAGGRIGRKSEGGVEGERRETRVKE